jgi:hypothetical protein
MVSEAGKMIHTVLARRSCDPLGDGFAPFGLATTVLDCLVAPLLAIVKSGFGAPQQDGDPP